MRYCHPFLEAEPLSRGCDTAPQGSLILCGSLHTRVISWGRSQARRPWCSIRSTSQTKAPWRHLLSGLRRSWARLTFWLTTLVCLSGLITCKQLHLSSAPWLHCLRPLPIVSGSSLETSRMLCARSTRLQMRQNVVLENPHAACKKCKSQMSQFYLPQPACWGKQEVQDLCLLTPDCLHNSCLAGACRPGIQGQRVWVSGSAADAGCQLLWHKACYRRPAAAHP